MCYNGIGMHRERITRHGSSGTFVAHHHQPGNFVNHELQMHTGTLRPLLIEIATDTQTM
jgi:hypothetical protein